MSIVTEIERIQNAKSSIKAAIENKGVVVGDGTLDTYASKIDEISGGTNFEITDASYLFYNGARGDIKEILISACKQPIKVPYMFYYANGANFYDLDISNIDGSKISNTSNMFGMQSLKTIKFLKNLGKGFTVQSSNVSSATVSFSMSNQLEHDGLMDIINNLYDLNLTYDVANGGTLYTQQLVLGATNLAKLTEEEIAVATNKGWVVS